MPPTVFTDFAQYSPSFWERRRGRPSTSNFDKIITPAKAEPSGQRTKYIAELIAELYQFDPPFMTERKGSAAMDEGTRREEESRRWYEFEVNAPVLQVGGVLSSCGRFWSSPDGLVGDDGVLELKNPLGKTHVEYLMAGDVLPTEYKCQVHGQLIVTERKWVDFVSYVPGDVRSLRVRVTPDAFTDRLRAELDKFWVKYQAALAAVAPQQEAIA